MPRPNGRPDPHQPSPRAMHYIKNKTNINEMRLKQTLDHFQREKIHSITNIDHDRLDVKDFLKDVKHCASDFLPESKIWLGERADVKKKREQQELQRNIFTAPAGRGRGKDGSRDVKTAPSSQENQKDDSEVVQVGIFFKKRKDVDPNRVHIDIYSRRNMYSSIGREHKNSESDAMDEMKREEEEATKKKLKEEAEHKRLEEEARRRRESEELDARTKAELALAEERRRAEADEMSHMDRPITAYSTNSESQRRHEMRAEMRRISGVRQKTDLEKREARIRAMNDNAELMKDLLIKNAKKRASQKKNKSPLEDRIRTFFTRIDDLQRLEEEAAAMPTTVEQQRRYVLMTKGVKAALEIKDDASDDYNPMHTL